eukprot:gnl/Dysnectes_brevis/2783_a3392_753.p1 GENE.gnl/Dysnectes_brevis/2783_a3392_753~~gnl/Dysnectes_brevis/2783_a3392_753.p1  ORF type:complete len:283 (-),score=83.92 gnl/Dysnectes_brevis/2783_a3392_753:45-893(-)
MKRATSSRDLSSLGTLVLSIVYLVTLCARGSELTDLFYIYDTPVTPGPVAFYCWGVISMFMVVFSLYLITTHALSVKTFHKHIINIALTASLAAGATWMVTFSSGQYSVLTLLQSTSFISSAVAYGALEYCWPEEPSLKRTVFVRLPIGAYFGWNFWLTALSVNIHALIDNQSTEKLVIISFAFASSVVLLLAILAANPFTVGVVWLLTHLTVHRQHTQAWYSKFSHVSEVRVCSQVLSLCLLAGTAAAAALLLGEQRHRRQLEMQRVSKAQRLAVINAFTQ